VASTPWRAALATALVTWAPLAVLAALEGPAPGASPQQSLLLDLEAHARYLVAAPLFLVAASVYLPELASTVRAFVDVGLIAESNLRRYDALCASTGRLLNSRFTEAGIAGFAYVVALVASPTLFATGATWATSADGHLRWAGWWRLLVSQPLFIALWGMWLWRLLLWIRFLRAVAQLDLRLVASHPDRLGGLRFVLIPLRGFSILAFALGTVAAGTVGEAVIVNGHEAAQYSAFILLQTLLVIATFCGPLLLLSRPLQRLKDQGIVDYGRLASHLGRQFEARWVRPGNQDVTPEVLGAPDFSATVDSYGIVAGARDVNPLVLNVRHVVMMAVATLLPYAPVVLAVMPLDQVMEVASKVFL
jgi:hypothetical protein